MKLQSEEVNKMTLSEALPGFKLMDALECVSELGWKTEFSAEEFDETGTGAITCSCGERVKTGGWLGQEHAWCPTCHKGNAGHARSSADIRALRHGDRS